MTDSDLGQLRCRAGVIDPGDMAGEHVLWVVVATAMPVYAALAVIRRADSGHSHDRRLSNARHDY